MPVGVLTDEWFDAYVLDNPAPGTYSATGDFTSFSSTEDPTHVLPVRVVGVTSASGNSSSVTVSHPEGLRQNESMFAFVSYDSGGDFTAYPVQTSSPANGWDWSIYVDARTPNADGGLSVFLKQHRADDPATTTFTIPAYTAQMTVVIVAIRDGTLVNINSDTANPYVTSHAFSANPVVPYEPQLALDQDRLLLLATGGTVNCTWDGSGWLNELRDDRSANYSSLAVYEGVVSNDAGTIAGGPYGAPLFVSSDYSATLLAALVFAPYPSALGYSGWYALNIDRTTAIKFDTIGSDMDDTRLVIFKDNTFGAPIYENDDREGGAIDLWSQIPDMGGFINLPVGLYYIRVWPYYGPDWDPADGNATLNITVGPFPEVASFVDNKNNVDIGVITDPAIGETYAAADFSGFTQSVDDPNEIITDWSTGGAIVDDGGWYSGWVKLVLTQDMYLAFDTYDSEMFDTVLFLYDGSSGAPTGAALALRINDDTDEEPFYSGRTQRQSAIKGDAYHSSTFLVAAGTYYIMLMPYSNSEWLNPPQTGIDPAEGPSALLRVIRTEVLDWLGVRASQPALPQVILPPPPYSSIVISYDGTDITDDVRIATASFTALVNGTPGLADLEIKDLDHSRSFTTGKSLTLDIDGVRRWGGFTTQVKKRFPLSVLDVDPPTSTARYWAVTGVDYNVLFSKRIIVDASNPAGNIDFDYPVGTYDDTIIIDLFDNYLNLSGDGLSRSGVTRVDIVTLDIPGVTSGKGTLTKGQGQVASAGYTWKQAMDVICGATGAIYYIDPNKVFHYVDVDTETASKSLTDVPTSATLQAGMQSPGILEDGTGLINDMLVWGTGTLPIVFSRHQDSTSIGDHDRWQAGLSTDGLIHQASANIVSASYVNGTPQSKRGGKDDARTVTARVFDPAFSVGQKVTTSIRSFGLVGQILPIRQMTITFPGPRQAIYDLVLSHAIDQPMSFFEQAPIVPYRWKPFDGFPGFDDRRNTYVPTIIDSFSRSVIDNSTHTAGNTNPHWLTGEHITWSSGSNIGRNTHYSVADGFGIIRGAPAHYPIYPGTEAQALYPGSKAESGTVDTGVSVERLLIKFQIGKREKIVQAMLGFGASGGPALAGGPFAWVNQSNIEDFGYNWTTGAFLVNNANTYFPSPNLQTTGGFPAGVSPIPTRIFITATPNPADDGYDFLTGTVYSEHLDFDGHPGGFYTSDRGGMSPWVYGSSWSSAVVGEFVWSRPAGFYPGSSQIRGIFFTGHDIRDAGHWDNKVYFKIASGNSYIAVDRKEGFVGAYGITTRPSNLGTGQVNGLATKVIDPDYPYWLEWWRPTAYESYVKIWADNESVPTSWMATSVSNAVSDTSPPPQQLSISASVFSMQSYDLKIDVIASGDARMNPGNVNGGLPGFPPWFNGTIYDFGQPFLKNSTQVWVNGQRYRVGIEYTESPPAGTLTLSTPITSADKITALCIPSNRSAGGAF